MPEVRPDRGRVVAIVGKLVAASMARHVALMPRSAELAARSIMREKPGADSGAPRSETNTNGDCALSRWWRRSSRISLPLRGCVAGVPFLALRRACVPEVVKREMQAPPPTGHRIPKLRSQPDRRQAF